MTNRAARALTLIAGCAATFLMGWGELAGPAVSHAASVPLPAWTAMGPDNCQYHCRPCNNGNGHDIVVHFDPAQNKAKSSHLETCNPGSCDHHACGDPELAARARDLWNDASGKSLEEIQELVEQNAELAILNTERWALQFLCTEGTVIASMPLPTSFQGLAD